MKKLFFTLLASIIFISIYGQAPQEINYQGVARNSSGTLLSNQNIGIKLDLHQGSAAGTVVFSETHNKTTNVFGLFTLGIGSVNASGFIAINWANGPYFLEVSMDPAGGTSYSSVGTQQFMSVPYALYAKTAGNASATPTITINAPNTVTSSAGSYTINVPAAISYSAGTGIDITGGVISNTASATTPTIVGTGATTVTGTYPNLTINTPTVAADQTVSLIGTGNATVTGAYPNFTVNVPNSSALPNALNGQFLYHTGTIWDTLPRNNLYFDGTNFGIGTTSPQANFHVVGAGRFDASVSTPQIYTNNIKITGGIAGQVLTSDAIGNGTWQAPAVNTPTINSGGVANVTNTSTNVYLVDVPAPSLNYNSGTKELTLTQNGATSTATLIGTGSNTVSIVGSGLATVTPTTGSTFTVSVPNPTYTTNGPISITGAYPNYTVNSVASPTTSLVAGNLNLTLLPSGNTYTLDVKSYSLTANSNTLTLSNGASITTATVPSSPSYSGTPNNISITSNTINLVSTGVATNNYGANATNAVPTFSVDNFGRLTTASQYTPNVAGDVIGSINTSTVSKLRGVNISTVAPTANQVLQFNAGSWTPSTIASTTITGTGTGIATVTTAATAFTVNVPNPTFNTATGVLGFGTTTINATPTLSLIGATLTSGPSTNSVNLATLPGLWSTVSSTNITTTNSLSLVGIGTGTTSPTYKLDVYANGSVPATIHGYNSGATASSTGVFGENPNNGIGVFGQSNSGKGVWGSSTSDAGIYGESTSGDGGKFILSNNTTTANAVNAQTNGTGVALFAKSYNATPLAAKFEGGTEILHTASAANPHLNFTSPAGSYGRVKFSNTGQGSFFTTEAYNDGSGNNEAYSIGHFNGINTKQVFLINGQRMAYINALNYPLTTFHVMTSTATASGGIASEGFAQPGQLNVVRNNNAGAGARTAVILGDDIGKLNFAGFDGSTFGDGAKIYAKAAENVTGSNKGTELIFAAVPTGTNTNKDAFKINAVGKLEVLSSLLIPFNSGTGKVLTSDGAGNASWQVLTAPAAAWTSTLGTTTLVNGADKVGIGTGAPQSVLEVVTDGSLTNGLRVSNNSSITNGPSIYLDGQNQDWTITGANAGNGSGANKFVIRDYTNAADRFVIDNTGKVGVGLTVPGEMLDVNGNVQIPAVNEYKYASAKTKYLNIPSNALHSMSSSYGITLGTYVGGYDGESGYAYIANGGSSSSIAVATAPVYLPDGAIVTELFVRYFDQDATYDGVFSLERKGISTINNQTMASYTTTGNSSAPASAASQSITTITNSTIDNANFAYYFKFKTYQLNTNIAILDIRIKYTVLKAD